MKSGEFQNVDITFPEETIVHALLTEEHLGCAHDSLVEFGCDENTAFKAFRDSIWANGKNLFIKDDLIMNCLSTMNNDFLMRINSTLKLDWNNFDIDNNPYVENLPETGKILYAIVKAVKKKAPEINEAEQGCYTTDKIFDAFYVVINIFHDKNNEPYMMMNISINDEFDGISW